MPSSLARPDATTGQRGWNRHPDGMRVGSGGSPCRIGRSTPPASGTTSSRAFVYGCRGAEQHLGGGTDLHHPAQVHHRDPIGDGPCQPEVVRHDHQRDVELVAELHQQREDLAADRRVEVRHGLVGDDHVRIEHEGAGDHDALTLSARELVGVVQVEALGRAQARARERLRDQVLLGLAVRALFDLVDPQTLGDDLVDRLAGVERGRRVLEDHLDLAAERPQALRVGRRAPCRGTRSSPCRAGSARGSRAPSWSCRSPTRPPARGPRPRATRGRPRPPPWRRCRSCPSARDQSDARLEVDLQVLDLDQRRTEPELLDGVLLVSLTRRPLPGSGRRTRGHRRRGAPRPRPTARGRASRRCRSCGGTAD